MLLSESLQALINSADDKIVKRGKEYYASQQIKKLTQSPDGRFAAEVRGSQGELYKVIVDTDPNGKVTDFSCSCPYDLGYICKHLVAVSIAIQNGKYKKVRVKSNSETNSISTAIQSADTDKLKAFVIEYAKRDRQFKTEVLLEFGKPDTHAELLQVKEQVREILSKYTHGGYIDYNDCNAICVEFDEILSLAEKRIYAGQAVPGFLVALHLLLVCVKLASTADSSSGALTDTMDYSLRVIDSACEAVYSSGSAQEQKKVYEKGVKEAQNKVFDSWGEWNYCLLRSCTRMVTNNNAAKLYAALDYLAGVYSKWSSYYLLDDKLTRLEIVRRLEGDEAAKGFIAENIELDEFRNIAVDTALQQADFALAEQLCIERLSREPNEHGVRVRQKEWLARLYEVYEKAGNTDKQIKTGEKLLLGGNLSYYEIIKTLYTEKGVWEQEYPLLRQRCSQSLPYYMYMDILKEENELRLLLEEVRRYPENSIFVYGKLLALEYPSDVYALMKAQIEEQAKEANHRKKYAKVCDSIWTFHEAGGKEEVAELIESLRQSFNRRPAMLDELTELKQRIAKSNQT